MLLCQFVPYPGTVHCTEQVRVRVPGTEVPHIYVGHMSHIYILSGGALQDRALTTAILTRLDLPTGTGVGVPRLHPLQQT